MSEGSGCDKDFCFFQRKIYPYVMSGEVRDTWSNETC